MTNPTPGGRDWPLLPLRRGVILPGRLSSLPVGRERTRALAQSLNRDDEVLIAVQHDPTVVDPVLAELHPVTRSALGLRLGVAICELDLDALRASAPGGARYAPLPKYPSVYRDFAVVVPEAVPVADAAEAIRSGGDGLVRDVTLQSVYRGDGVADGHKSVAFSAVLRHDEHTLDEDEIRSTEASVWRAIADRVGGVPRVIV